MSNSEESIRILGTGLVYRNPKAHVRSEHAYFPSVAVLPKGELLASLVLGEAFEAANCRTHIARSSDNGETWQLEGPIYPGTPGRLTSDAVRLTALPDGRVLAFMVRSDRDSHPGEGLTNSETLGFVPTELLLFESNDSGRSWSEPRILQAPLEGPSFELCCPITPMSDGRLFLPTSTWQDWDGRRPNGVKMVAFISEDAGATWPDYRDVMVDPDQKVVYWESKIVQLSDGSLLAAAWAYDTSTSKDLPNQYALSQDSGATWTAPTSTRLIGQTLTPFALADGRILSVYRRTDQPGLWANVSRLEGGEWVNEAELALWGARAAGLTGESDNMAENFQVLRFGAPCIAGLSDGSLFVAFWCYEDCVSNIRWFKLGLG